MGLFFYFVLDIRPSSIQHPASSIQHPASSIQHPASSIQHPASSIQHPASKLGIPAEWLPPKRGLFFHILLKSLDRIDRRDCDSQFQSITVKDSQITAKV